MKTSNTVTTWRHCCDRCKDVHESPLPDVPGWGEILMRNNFTTQYYLCPECIKKLYEWLKTAR